jgi:ankyrin repeat protein
LKDLLLCIYRTVFQANVLQTLVHSWKHRALEEASASIFHGTVGVAFLATPHKASTLLAWKNILSTIAEITYPVELDAGKQVKDLSTEEQESLFTTTRDFATFLGDRPIAIVSFFEEDELNTQHGPLRITDFDSAIGTARERLAYLKGNHLTLCKFQDPTEPGYVRIETILREWYEDTTVEQIAAGITLGDRQLAQPSNWGAPLSLDQVSGIATNVDSMDLSQSYLRRQRRLFQEVLNVSWMERKVLPPREAGSCRWILGSPHYSSWKKPDGKKLLHLTGPPGCGKSILANFVIDELQKDIKASAPDGNSTAVLYFFFELKQRVDFGFHDLLRIFLSQLLDLKPHYMRYVPLEMIPKQGPAEKKQTLLNKLDELEELLQILLSMLRDPDCDLIYCVVDGLDECDAKSTNWIIRLLDQVFQIPSVKVLLTSIPFAQFGLLPELASKMKKWTQTYDEDESFNIASADGFKKDFLLLMKPRLKSLALSRGLLPKLQKELDAAVLEHSEMGYVWATLILQIIETKPSVGTVNDFLRDVVDHPPDLSVIYDNICMTVSRRRRLSNSSWEFGPPVFKVLYFLRYALRPVSLEELAVSLSVKQDSRSVDEVLDNKPLGFEKYLRQELGNLLRFENGTVFFINSTFKRYIDERGLPDEEIDSVHLPRKHKWFEEQTHLEMAMACVKLLCLVHASPATLYANHQARNHDRGIPFAKYSQLCWANHLRCAGQSGKQLNGLLRHLWNSTEDPLELFRSYLPSETKAVQLESHPFLSVLVQLDLPFNLFAALPEQKNISLHQLKDLLRYASEYCSDAMVDSIYELVQRTDSGKYFSLSMKSTLDMVGVLQLLRNDCTVNDVLGSINKISSLPEKGQILSAALKWKPEEFVLQLLRKLPTEGSSWGEERTPLLLQEAAKIQSAETIELLLNEYEYEDFGSCLHSAAQRGNVKVCELLLNRGADCNRKNNKGQTPLHIAAMTGQILVVKLLVQFGADPTIADKKGRQPLHRAAGGGYTKILELLLNIGAQVDLLDERRRTALFASCHSGMLGTAQLLIHYGADISIKDKYGDTPLHAAVVAGTEDIVKLLLQNGSDLNVRNAQGISPLHNAAWRGCSQIAEVLVLDGADVNANDDNGRTPLHYACMSKPCPEDIVTLLIETGADTGAQDQDGKRPLHMAARHSNAAIVTQLSDRLSTVDAPDFVGDTPLHVSCASESRSSFSIAKALIRSGGDMDTENHSGQTPWSLAQSNRNKWYEQFLDWWKTGKLEAK